MRIDSAIIEVLAKAADVVAGDQEGFVKFDGTSDGKDDLAAPYRVVLGLVHKVLGDTFVMAPSFDPDADVIQETYMYSEDVKVYLIDTENTNNMVRETTFGEVVGYEDQPDSASKIMVYTNDADLVSIFIFK